MKRMRIGQLKWKGFGMLKKIKKKLVNMAAAF